MFRIILAAALLCAPSLAYAETFIRRTTESVTATADGERLQAKS